MAVAKLDKRTLDSGVRKVTKVLRRTDGLRQFEISKACGFPVDHNNWTTHIILKHMVESGLLTKAEVQQPYASSEGWYSIKVYYLGKQDSLVTKVFHQLVGLLTNTSFTHQFN